MQAALALLCAVACFAVVDAVGLSCPSGWYGYAVGGVVIKCYFISGINYPNNLNSQYASDYFRSHEICYLMGGRVAMLRNQTDQNGAVAAIQNVQNLLSGVAALWIDGQDLAYPGQPLANWFYTNGRTFTYSNWNSGEPNNDGQEENCASIYVGSPNNWNDVTCNTVYPVLCERTF